MSQPEDAWKLVKGSIRNWAASFVDLPVIECRGLLPGVRPSWIRQSLDYGPVSRCLATTSRSISSPLDLLHFQFGAGTLGGCLPEGTDLGSAQRQQKVPVAPKSPKLPGFFTKSRRDAQTSPPVGPRCPECKKLDTMGIEPMTFHNDRQFSQ